MLKQQIMLNLTAPWSGFRCRSYAGKPSKPIGFWRRTDGFTLKRMPRRLLVLSMWLGMTVEIIPAKSPTDLIKKKVIKLTVQSKIYPVLSDEFYLLLKFIFFEAIPAQPTILRVNFVSNENFSLFCVLEDNGDDPVHMIMLEWSANSNFSASIYNTTGDLDIFHFKIVTIFNGCNF